MTNKGLFDEPKEPAVKVKTKEEVKEIIKAQAKNKSIGKKTTSKKKATTKKDEQVELTQDIGDVVVNLLDIAFMSTGFTPITPIEELEKKNDSGEATPTFHKEYSKAITQFLNQKVGDKLDKKAVEVNFYLMTISLLFMKAMEAKSKGFFANLKDKLKGLFKKNARTIQKKEGQGQP